MRKLGGVLVALLLSLIPALFIAQPAEAIVYGSFRICNSSGGFGYIYVYDKDGGLVDGTRYRPLYPNGSCTGWLAADGIRVDTDPAGDSHSYKLKVTDADGNGGSYGPCHTNSDNHASDPPNPTSGTSTRVYYRNYDHGDCTN